MDSWKSFLRKDPIPWLLEEDNPSVRYFTLVDILDRHESDPDVRKAKAGIMLSKPVQKILSRQEEGGFWGIEENFYIKSKYKGTVWQFIILAELGADGNDNRIKKASEFILAHSRDIESGGFAYYSGKKGGGDPDKVIPCLTGNMLWGLIRFGYLEDNRVRKGIDWMLKYRRFDDGEGKVPQGWPYRYEKCWGNHTCHMGIVKFLKAFSGIPEKKRTDEMNLAVSEAGEFLLKHHIYKKSHDLKILAKPEWLKLTFPWLWNTDILEILAILTKLGCKDKRMEEALNIVINKQDREGRWVLEKGFNGRYLVNLEKTGSQSKWITLNAVKVIKRYYESM